MAASAVSSCGVPEGVVSALEALSVADLSTCGHGELDALAGAVQRVRGFVSSCEVAIARRRSELAAVSAAALADLFDRQASGGSGADQRPAPPAPTSPCPEPSTVNGERLDLSTLGDARDRRPGRECEQDRGRAEVCAVFGRFEAALAAGGIDMAHVDALVAVWRDLDDVEQGELRRHEAVLVARAEVEAAERFRRHVRDLARRVMRDHGRKVLERQRAAAEVRRWIGRDGMGHLHATFDPEATAAVFGAVDAHLAAVRQRPDNAGVGRQRVEVDAFVELVTASTRLEPRHPELVVIVDHATLVTGVFGPGSICETADGQPLPPDTARRLACDAGIIPVVLDGAGVPLDEGRSRRLATREQRRALAAMYATCGMPGCDARFERCRIHHLDPWTPTGPTDLDNLIPCCDRHHHQIHEGGWTLSMTPDRTVTLRAPDGTIRFHGDTRTRLGADDTDIWTAATLRYVEPDCERAHAAVRRAITARFGDIALARRRHHHHTAAWPVIELDGPIHPNAP